MSSPLSDRRCGLVVAAVLLPSLLWAQTEPSPGAASIPVQALPEPVPAPAPVEESKPSSQQLSEVVVTAQKTKQSARRVPVSVTALSGDFIKQTGASSLADVSLYVPNARVDAHDLGSPQIFIRGFGTNAFNPAFEGSVAFVQDELYLGRPGYFTESMYDVERVEVLRGPQGTLFGKNTIAGVFNVTSKSPSAEPAADLQVFGGEHGERRFEGGFGGMLGDHFGARLGFLNRRIDGETYNQKLDRFEDAADQQAERLKLRGIFGNGLSTELTAATSETRAPFWPYQLKQLDADTRRYLQAFDPDIEDDPRNFRTSFDTRGWIRKGSDTGSLKTDWDMGEVGGMSNLTGTLILGASGFFIDQLNDLDISPADIARLDSHEDHDQVSTELRFAGRGDTLFSWDSGFEFVGGLYHYQSNYKLLARILAGRDFASYLLTDDAAQLIRNAVGLPPGGGLGFLGLPGLPQLAGLTGPLLTDGDFYQYDYDQHTDANALFGQVTWKLTDKISLTPGVRLGIEKKKVDVAGNGFCTSKNQLGQIPGLPATPCIIQTLLDGQDYSETDQRRKEYDFSPKLALQYFAEHSVNYYASFARATKSGGFNALALNTDKLQFQGERAKTYELGAKGRFFNRSLFLNLGVYQTDFQDLQVLAFNGAAFDVGNADAVSRGIEGDFQWLTPYRPLRVMGSFGVLDAKYTRYLAGPAPISQGIGETQDLSGRRVAFAPRGTGSLTPTLAYEFAGLRLTLAGDLIYQGNQFTDTDLDPSTYTPSYVKYNARLILGGAEDRWSLAIGGNNLADKRVLNQVIDTIFFPGTFQAQQASGRQLFAMLNIKI